MGWVRYPAPLPISMAHIIKIIRCENKGERAKITVQLDDGGEAVVYVGGSVEVYLVNQEIRAFVKKYKSA